MGRKSQYSELKLYERTIKKSSSFSEMEGLGGGRIDVLSPFFLFVEYTPPLTLVCAVRNISTFVNSTNPHDNTLMTYKGFRTV